MRETVLLLRRLSLAIPCLLLGQVAAQAQSTPPPQTTDATQKANDAKSKSTVDIPKSVVPGDDDVVELSPFEVVEDKNGYYSGNTVSGTRFNTKLADLASAVTVVSKEQMEDFAMLDINDVFLYTAGTEGTGTYTDFSIDRNGSVSDNVQLNPTGANRVRGIAPANIAFNNMESMARTPIDPSTNDGIEISRGPNASVFGLGNPSGTVNQLPISPNLRNNKVKWGNRVDDQGGYRTDLDMNRVLKNGKLAVRATAVFQHDAFSRKPSGVDSERYNGVVSYQPFKSTKFTVGGFYYHMYGNRPNSLPPRDNLSYWIASGKPTWDPVTNTIHVNGNSIVVAGSGTNRAYNGPDYFSDTLLGGNRSQLFIDQDGLSYWSSPQATNSTVILPGATTLGPTSGGLIDKYLQTTGAAGAKGTAAKPSAQPLFTTTPTISDKSLYDWDNINLSAPNRVEDSNKTYTAQLDQNFINTPLQTLAGQLAVMREDSQRYQRNLLGIANDNGQSGQLEVDINERRLDGTPNPFFMRPFIATDRPRTVEAPQKWDTYRAQLAYKIDLTHQESALKWLGQLQVSGYDEYKYRISRQYSYRDAMIDAKTWLPAGLYRGTQSAPKGTPSLPSVNITQGLNRFYVGDATGNNVDYAPGNFSYGTYPLVWGNATTGFNNENTTLGLVGADKTGSTFNTKKILKTVGGVAQGHFLGDRLVATFGLREDRVYNQFGNANPNFLNPDGLTFNRSVVDGWTGNWSYNSGKTKTTQFAIRPFQDLSFVKNMDKGDGVSHFFSSALNGLSFYTNRADSFLPADPAQDLFLRILPNPTGQDKSFAIGLNLFDGKVVVRVTRYKTLQINSRNGDANTIAQRVIRTDLPLLGATPGRFMLYNVAGATVTNSANFNRLGWIKVANPTWSDAQVATELSNVMQMSPEVIAALSNPTPPIAATQDIEAIGTEAEINVNMNRYWTVSAALTDSQAINRNISNALTDWIAQRMPVWTSLVDPTVAPTAANPNQLWWNTLYPGATQTAQQNFLAFVQSPYNVLKQLEGKANPENRRYNVRISTNYLLAGATENRFLKNLNVGGALRWEDKGAIGYKGIADSNGIYQSLDTNQPIWDSAHTHIDLFFGYRMKIWSDKVGAKFQLNIRNLTENGGLQPVAAFPDGSISTYRIKDPRSFILSASFDM